MFYGALLAGLAFGGDAPARGEMRLRLRRAASAAAICLVPVSLFFVWVRAVPGIGDKKTSLVKFNDPLGVIHAMMSPFASYDLKVDLLFALPFLALVAYALAKRKFSAHKGLLAAAAAFAIAALFMPEDIGHTAYMDWRLPLMALLAALAATRLGTKHNAQMLAAAVVLVTLRTAWIGLNWSASVPIVDAMRQVLAEVPAGARVLPMQHQDALHDRFFNVLGRSTASFDETFRHYPALMVPWRHAFTPMLFAQYREKPIAFRPPYDQIGTPTGGVLLSVNALLTHRLVNQRMSYVNKWRENFDYVLVLNADRPDKYGPFRPPAELQLVSDRGFAQLYRVRKKPAPRT